MNLRKIKFIFSIFSLVAVLAFFVMPVFAQDLGLGVVGENIALGGGDIRATIARILNVGFGLLGIVMVGIVVYSGFLYMTSAGDPQKTLKARKWIINSIIGLAIILSAYAITFFVVRSLTEATNPSGTGTGGGGGCVNPPCSIGTSGSIFRVLGITPSGDRPPGGYPPDGWPPNNPVKFIFSKTVDPGTINGNLSVKKITGGTETAVVGTFNILGDEVDFVPETACPPPNDNRKCFDFDSNFRAQIAAGLKAADGANVYCGLGSDCDVNFKIGHTLDLQAPMVVITSPINNGAVPQGVFTVSALATDDVGVSSVEFFLDNVSIGNDVGGGERSFTAIKDYDATALPLGSSHQIKATAYDIDSNLANSAAVSVTIRAAHCFNGVKDSTETGIDCGAPDCLTCPGSGCNYGSDCSSGVCQAGICVAVPVVTAFLPADGAPGNLVTIFGRNFGSAPGNVTLNGISALSGCADAWSDNQIIIVVPTGASTGKVQVVNRSSLSGQSSADFVVNNIIRPGVCSISPASGQAGASYTISGRGFGTTADSIVFNTRLATINSWSADAIVGLVPTLTDGRYVVKVKVGSEDSNGLYFNVLPQTGGTPTIRSISPELGPRGEYVTIFGSNFGSTTGNVVFWRGTDAADADISFPDGCGVNYWQDGTIVVKVPGAMRDSTAVTAGSYEIQVIQGTRSSNKVGFTVNDRTPKPGICRIVPDNGPPGRRVNLIGERFGADADGKVNFWQNKLADKIFGAWSAGGATVKVPAGAQSGPVTLVSAGTLSNGLNFRVADCGKTPEICVSGEKCCAGSCMPSGESCAVGPTGSYLWRFATGPIVVAPRVLENQDCSDGAIQSPSPWKGSIDACTNSEVSAQFNVSMNTIIPAGAVRLEDCTGTGGAFDAGACTTHPVTIKQITWSTASANDNDKINITTDDLIANHAYQVTLVKTLTSAKNVPMDADYVWRFRASATGACTLSRVSVAPSKATITEAAQKKDFTAYPAAANCNILKCTDDFGFVWRASDPGIAAVAGLPITSDNLCKATASPLQETGETPVNVIALSTTYNKEGRGDLYIKYTPPQIVDFWPSSKCPAACTNVDVGGEFNVEMNVATVNADNIKIYECLEPADSTATPTCAFPDGLPTALPGAVNYNSTAEHKTFSVAVDLEKGKRYLVRIKGMPTSSGDTSYVKSASGASLTGLNPAPYFQWQFAVNDNASTCAVDRVELSPLESILKLIGARANFNSTPFGKPDACNATGPRLRGDVYSWDWVSTKTDVGVIIDAPPVTATSTLRSVEARGPGSSDITAKVTEAPQKTSPASKFNVVCACNADADCESSEILTSYDPDLTAPEVGCSIPAKGGNQCCYPRPKVASVMPDIDRPDVCRNALVQVVFDQIMSTSTGQSIIEKCSAKNSGCADAMAEGTFKQFVQDGRTVIQFFPKKPWDKNQWYRVTLKGGDAIGWKNTHGVSMAQDYVWSWQTGGGLCVLDKVEVSPSYYFFHTDVNDPNDDAGQPEINDADAVFSANYISVAGGDQDIVPIPDVYDWITKWVSNDSTVVAAKDSENRAADPPDDSPSVLGIAQNKNGTADIVATVTVTDATLVTPVSRTLSASAKTDVLLCENIWPANPTDLEPAGFKDAAYGFRTYYCRDIKTQQVSLLHPGTILRWFSYIYKKAVAQVTGRGEQILDVLPVVSKVEVPEPPAPDILKEYLLQNPESRDAIGIRVMTNPAHLSPLRWYKEVKNFKGAPKPIKLDGYEAVQDGRTIYAAGAHQDGGGKIFTNIYILSYNEGAGADTVNIFGQIVDNFKLNTNIKDLRVCNDGKKVCASDLDCPASVCENFKREARGTCNTAPAVSCTPGEPCPASVCEGVGAAKPGKCNTDGLKGCQLATAAGDCPASVCKNIIAETLGKCNTDNIKTCRPATVSSDCPASVCNGVGTSNVCSNDSATSCVVDSDCGKLSSTFNIADYGTNPQGVAYDRTNNLLWVTMPGSGRVISVNPVTGVVTGAAINVGGTPRPITTGDGYLWVGNLGSNSISKINPATRVELSRIPVKFSPLSIVYDYDNGGLWVAGSGVSQIVKIDGIGNSTYVSIPIAMPNVYFYGMAIGGGRVWVSDIFSRKIYGLDAITPTDLTKMITITPSGDMTPGSLTFDSNQLIAVMYNSPMVQKYDLAGKVVGTYAGSGGGWYAKNAVIGGNYIWFGDNYGNKVYKIDKNTMTKTAEYATGLGTWGVAFGMDITGTSAVWAAGSSDNTLTKIFLDAPVCNKTSTPGTCSGMTGQTCAVNADCAGVAKDCAGYLPAGTGTCSGTTIVCADNSVCAAVPKLCNGAEAAVSGKCRGSNLSCTTNSDCATVAACADYEAAGPGNCSVGGIPCASDAECRAATSVCDAGKTKLTRDVKRLLDFQDLTTSLEAYKQKNIIYPRLEAGTFIRSLAASKWGSWQSVLGGALGAKELAVDPINQFRDCARVDVASVDAEYADGGVCGADKKCTISKTACVSDSNCNFQPISSGSNIYYSNGNAAGTYNFVVAKNGIYRFNLNTQNRGINLADKKYSDLQPSAFCAGSGIYHHLKISVDGVYKGALCNPAAASAQIGILSVGYLGAGAHRADIAWDNDWYPNYDGVCGKDKKCTISKTDCATNNDCDGHYDSNLQINNVYLLPAPLDKDTCWSEADKNFVCTSGSHVYQYRNIGGSDYSLMADFEYATAKGIWMGNTSPTGTPEAGGAFSDKMQITNTCNDVPYGGSALCGDGVVGTGEECELGQTRMTASCTEGCGADGKCVFTKKACTTSADCYPGIRKQECYLDTTETDKSKQCKWKNIAGNSCIIGRCGDGVVQSPTEACDDGFLNGKYGYCNLNCTGFAAHCGDGHKDELNGEKCDLGSLNGQYGGVCQNNLCSRGVKDGSVCTTDADCACAWDCSGPGPRCGDGVKHESEECDGNVDTSTTEIFGSCSNVSRSCRKEADGTAPDCNVNEIMGSCSAGKTGTDCRANANCDKPEIRGTCSTNVSVRCTPTTDCSAYDPTWAAGINKEDNFSIASAGSFVGLSASGGVIRGADYKNDKVWSGTLGNFLNAGAFPKPLNVAVGGSYGAAISALSPHLVIVPFDGTIFNIAAAKTYKIDNDAVLFDIASDGQFFWATNGATKVYKINPATGTAMTLTFGIAAIGITFDGTNIWTANPSQNSISKISTSGNLLGTYNLGSSYNPIDITYDSRNSKLWASDNKNSKIYSINPGNQVISNERSVSNNGNPPVSIAFDNNSGLWVSYGNPLAAPPIVNATVTRLWSRIAGTCNGYSAAVSGVCDGYKPPETGLCNDYSSACAPQGGRAYLRDRTCSNSCSWDSWSVCKPVGSCGNGAVEPGEECDNGNIGDVSGGCVMCKKSRCGDGYVQTGVEQCDAGAKNGVPCNTMYGGTCNYCGTTCKLTTRTGPYCGNGTADVGYGEQCDPNTADPVHPDFVGANCESYGFALGALQCNIQCGVNVGSCKTCAQATKALLGDGVISGVVKDESGGFINEVDVELLAEDGGVLLTGKTEISPFAGFGCGTNPDCSGTFILPGYTATPNLNLTLGIATSAHCFYRVRASTSDGREGFSSVFQVTREEGMKSIDAITVK